MICITENGLEFDISSLYAYFQILSNKHILKGLCYEPAIILVLLVMAKLSGEGRPTGIAQWAKNRTEQLADFLHLKWKQMPHHSTFRRILAEVIDV